MLALGAAALAQPAASAPSEAISPAEWSAYKASFLDPSGRIVDTGNGGISHSEGQGYGLLLAFLGNAPADFDAIWSFTRTELLLRDDGLAAWRWEPGDRPHVTDPNDAADGDILIAYALALAGERWRRPDLLAASARLAAALGREVVKDIGDAVLLMPAVQGFGPQDRADGPVVNPSYWVFEAFPVLARMAPDGRWDAVGKDGVALLRRLADREKLPPDWVSLAGEAPRPAKDLPSGSGYDAIRVPLYLMRAGTTDPALLRPLLEAMSGEAAARLPADPGYRIVPALLACVLDRTPLPVDLRHFTPTAYYPSTLQLLALSFARSHHEECL